MADEPIVLIPDPIVTEMVVKPKPPPEEKPCP
jgi:hypothetical protein